MPSEECVVAYQRDGSDAVEMLVTQPGGPIWYFDGRGWVLITAEQFVNERIAATLQALADAIPEPSSLKVKALPEPGDGNIQDRQ